MGKLLSEMKMQFVSLLNLAPASSVVIGTPRKTAKLNDYVTRTGAEKIVLKEGASVKLDPPVLNTPEIPAAFLNIIERNVPEQSVVVLNNGRIWGRNGAVITNDDVFIEDVSREFGIEGKHKGHSVFHNFSLGKPQYVDGTVAVATTAGAGVYYHWILDVLPRMIMLKEAGVFDKTDHIVTDYSGSKFQKETLETIGVKEDQLITCGHDRNFHLQAKVLYVPTLLSELSRVNKYECDLLRSYFLKSKPGSTSKSRRIYISRGSSGSRILINEGELIQYLDGLGFEVVRPEHYTVQEQAEIFNSAEIIVGPHGSAFANVLFSEPGAKLVDIIPATNIVPCFYDIAAVNGLKYFGFIGEGVPINDSYKNDNIRIDIAEFKSFFEKEVLN